MLVVVPLGWFSRRYAVRDTSRGEIGELGFASLRERGALRVDGAEYQVSREGLAGDFILAGGGGSVARAAKPSAFRRALFLKVGDTEYALRPESAFGRGYLILAGDTQVGRIAPLRRWGRTLEADLPEQIASPVRMFILWLVLLMVRRQRASDS
ncbi:MAG: hypothetical protein AB1778_04680 [Candidatus Bipolaricaulota bacterium]